MLRNLKHRVLEMLPAGLAGRLRAARVRWSVRNFQQRVVEHTYGKAGLLKVSLPDPLAAAWYDHDCADLPEIAALRKSRLRHGARVFDIGAHQGVVAMMLAHEVGPNGVVLAVEPNRHNVAAAEVNRDLNLIHHLNVVRAAVADRAGTLDFTESLNGQLDDGSGSWGRVAVEAVTIDGLADRFGVPDVVFLDIEGAECMALAGAQRVLASGADFFVEVHVGAGLEKLGGSVDSVLSYFPSDKYTLLVRADADQAFRAIQTDDPVARERFFLIALLAS